MSIGWNSTLGQQVADRRRTLLDLADFGRTARHVTVSPELLQRTADLLADLVEAETNA